MQNALRGQLTVLITTQIDNACGLLKPEKGAMARICGGGVEGGHR